MKLLEAAPGIISGLSTIGGWLGIGEKRQDKRQVNQQTKLNEVNAKTSRELADYEQDLRMKMWKDTNYGGQLAEAEKAGVSKAAAIGGSGTGTQGASVGSVGGGSAADAAATTNARSTTIAQGMQLASQLALQKAQKENIEADTANKVAEAGNTAVKTEGGKIENYVAEQTKEDKMNAIIANARKEMETQAAMARANKIGDRTLEDQVRGITEGVFKQIQENKGLTTENKKKTAELAVAQFEAEMAKSGISPKTPWYIKLITDQLEKFNLNPLK